MRLPLSGVWLFAIIGIVVFSFGFFVAFDHYLAPVKAGHVDLAFRLAGDTPEDAAKPQAYAVASGVTGTVDSADIVNGELHIKGWVVDQDDPSIKLQALIFVDNHFVGAAVARVFRADLLVSANLKNGTVGFEGQFPIKGAVRSRGHTLRVYGLRLQPSVGVNELSYGPDIHLQTPNTSRS